MENNLICIKGSIPGSKIQRLMKKSIKIVSRKTVGDKETTQHARANFGKK